MNARVYLAGLNWGQSLQAVAFTRLRARGLLFQTSIWVVFLLSSVAQATPSVVRVDGSIFDSLGVPVTASKDIQIKAYDAASGGTLLWTSPTANASVSAGRFTINMDAASGSSPSLVTQIGLRTASQGIYFQIEVDSGAANGSMDSAQIVLPRIRAKGTMFALNAAEADSLRGVTATAAEMNYLAGVTSSIQTQINSISPMSASVITSSTAAAVNNAYFTNSASLVGVTLPSNCAVGDRVKVAGVGTGGWKIVQQAGQTIDFSASSNSTASGSVTTSGTGGYLKSIDAKAAVEIVCRVANTSWQVTASDGSYTGDYLAGVSTFTASGNFTVPANVRSLTLHVWGAGGGGGAAGTAGAGAGGGGGSYVSKTIDVKAGDLLYLTVGTAGGGGTKTGSASGGGGGGGGYSAVAMGGSYVVIAGGGGGGGGGTKSAPGTAAGGGGGGDTDGTAGWGSAGSKGTAYVGGAAGTGGNGTAGTNYKGGTGGQDTSSNEGNAGVAGLPGGGTGGDSRDGTNTCGGGGGGGGFFGGGGGRSGAGSNTQTGGGGGGGASLGASTTVGSNGSGTTGGNPGNNSGYNTGNYGKGGNGGAANNNGATGNNGLVVISF